MGLEVFGSWEGKERVDPIAAGALAVGKGAGCTDGAGWADGWGSSVGIGVVSAVIGEM